MARKKPEAIQALEAIRPTCAECGADAFVRFEGGNLCETHYVARATRGAAEAMTKAGLDRAPGEPHGAWRSRVLRYLREKLSKIGEVA